VRRAGFFVLRTPHCAPAHRARFSIMPLALLLVVFAITLVVVVLGALVVRWLGVFFRWFWPH